MAGERRDEYRERLRSLLERVRRGSGEDAVPLSDLASLEGPARRARAVRLGCAAALIVTVLAIAASVPDVHGRRFLPADTVAVVVLDLSSSIRPTTYRLIGLELASLAKTDQRVGLVVFSDVAYEALPPGTPASELQAFARYYQDDKIRRARDGTPLARNPWDEWFSAGTNISSGLQLAAQLLRLSGAGRGGVVLFSDLADDPTDLRPLGRVISLYEQRHIPLRVVALDPTREDRDFWVELLGPGSLSNVQIPTGDAGRGSLVVESAFPARFVVLGGLVVLLLAANVLLAEPITWQRRSA
jgi:hypothetical protein